jgi:23S rRNA (guanosine2251-2'-O)-methyltransferase
MRKLSTNELNRLSIEEFKNINKIPLVIILDNIRSQNNIGSIFRTADAFLLQEIHLCGITATPPHREIHKTALGATETVKWRYFSSTIESVDELKKTGFHIYAIEQTINSTPLSHFKVELNTGIAIVFGNEVLGIDEGILNEVEGCIEIPQFGSKHSLNVSVAAGIVIWHLFNQMIPAL